MINKLPVLTQEELDNEVDKDGMINPSSVSLAGKGAAVVRTNVTKTLTVPDEVITIVPSVMVDVYLVNNGALLLQDEVVATHNSDGLITSISVTGTLTGDVLFIYQYEALGAVIDRGYTLTQSDIDNKRDVAGAVNPSIVELGKNTYALTLDDIGDATPTKGLVSGEQLASLGGGGGAAVKTILVRDDGAGGSTWQHLISSADLTGGDDFIFILGSSSAADLNVVCIPTEASVPELANISELKLVIYGGTGKSGFSENFNGVGTGAQVLGTEGVAGSGCVIARKVGLDTWYLSYEVTKPSGPEVLKDWTTVSGGTHDLISGLSLTPDHWKGFKVEIADLHYAVNRTTQGRQTNFFYFDLGATHFTKTSGLGTYLSNTRSESREILTWDGDQPKVKATIDFKISHSGTRVMQVTDAMSVTTGFNGQATKFSSLATHEVSSIPQTLPLVLPPEVSFTYRIIREW